MSNPLPPTHQWIDASLDRLNKLQVMNVNIVEIAHPAPWHLVANTSFRADLLAVAPVAKLQCLALPLRPRRHQFTTLTGFNIMYAINQSTLKLD